MADRLRHHIGADWTFCATLLGLTWLEQAALGEQAPQPVRLLDLDREGQSRLFDSPLCVREQHPQDDISRR